jgi:Flp pilus assembly protein TadG
MQPMSKFYNYTSQIGLLYSCRQRGVVIVQTVIALTVLLGMAALALDLGNAYLNKTRLQNSLDAAALAAAKEYDKSEDTVTATSIARAVFGLNTTASGNKPLADGWNNGSGGDISLEVEFSPTLTAGSFSTAKAGPYVRVSATGFSLDAFFARVLGLTEFQVTGSAVAGPSAQLAKVCNVAPILLCMNSGGATAPYWGYDDGEIDVVVKQDIGPGNFGFLSFDEDSGASDLQSALAGRFERCIDTDDAVGLKTGVNTNQVISGINSRFEPCDQLQPKLECTDASGNTILRPDMVSRTGLSYSAYAEVYQSEAPVWDYAPPRARRNAGCWFFRCPPA